MKARVTFHRCDYEGELLYLHLYPVAIRDPKHPERILRFEQHPQRVGLMVGGVSTHFTVPERVELLKGCR